MELLKLKTAVLFLVLAAMLVSSSFRFRAVCVTFSSSTVEMHGGPIRLYIVDLEGVSGFRAANHSAVVEGAKQATFINIET